MGTDCISDLDLLAAQRICLVDPNRPGWVMPLHVSLSRDQGKRVEIAIDSRDRTAIELWRQRVNALNLPG